MRDEDKTKDHLIKDLRVLRKRLAELEEFETAHLRIEEELLKFSHVVAQSPSAIIITDTNGSIEYVNPKFTEITGYTIEEVIGKNPRFLKSGKTTPEEYANLWNTISSGREWRGEFCNKKKNGEFFWEYASISPVHHFNGTISHYVAIKEDITERKRAEEALLESEEKFRKISSSAQDAIIMMGPDGNISFWNEAAERIFGYTDREAIGKYLHQFIVPSKYYQSFESKFSRFTKTGDGTAIGETLELSALRRDGTEFPVELSLSSARIKNGWHAVGIVRDISKRKKAEDEVRAAKLYMDNIIKSMANALIVISPDAIIRTVNTSACELLEFTEGELVGQSIDSIISEEMQFINTLMKLIEHGSIKNHEMYCKTKSGQKIPVCINATAMYSQDISPKKTIGIVFNIRDVREMKQMQKQLIQSAKMASLGTLAAGVAHEIKNPLAIILQGIEYLKYSLSSDATLIDVAERINKAVLRADRIVKGLLNFSRQTPFNFAETDIASVVEESISFVELQAARKNIMLIRQFAPNLPNVMTDSDQMKQVFINIFNNAFEAMSQGGTIAISLEQIKGGDGKNYLWIKFADNGCGIPEKDLQNVFDPFFSTKRKDGNSGLGLSIIKGIIDGHLGTINIESTPGKGTSVIIKLPFIT